MVWKALLKQLLLVEEVTFGHQENLTIKTEILHAKRS